MSQWQSLVSTAAVTTSACPPAFASVSPACRRRARKAIRSQNKKQTFLSRELFRRNRIARAASDFQRLGNRTAQILPPS
eukprot:316484-Prorocentrum_minimum.AAC.1